LIVALTFRSASAAEGQARKKKEWENHSVHVGEFCTIIIVQLAIKNDFSAIL
jgi:hypothetical protein